MSCSGLNILAPAVQLFSAPAAPTTKSHQALVMPTLRSGKQPSDEEEIKVLLQAVDALALHLIVKPSTIKAAGEGLFTSVDLPANAPICLYYGELSTDRPHGRYCIKVGTNLSLDAEALLSFTLESAAGGETVIEMINLGRYVNDARGGGQQQQEEEKKDRKRTAPKHGPYNMRYGRLLRLESRPPFVVMSSRRRIAAGEELFASYGVKYWQQWDHLAAASSSAEDSSSSSSQD